LDKFGQVFTIDAMFALVIITLLIGISANTMDIAGNKIREYSFEQSFQRIAIDTTDVLIKTPGVPENWEDVKDLSTVTPGLAKIDNVTHRVVENTLSNSKISRLRENHEILKKMLPTDMDYSLVIYPINNSLPIIGIIDKDPPSDIDDVSVVNRTVLYDYMFMYPILTIKPAIYMGNSSSKYICTHSHMDFYKHQWPDFKKKKSGWLCSAFSINLKDLKSKDFYILTDPPVLAYNSIDYPRWILDTPNNTTYNSKNFASNPIMINDRISEIMGNKSSEIFVLHVFTSGDPENTFNTYIIDVPKGTPTQDVRIDCMEPQPAFFVLKLWMA
jgi:hypothetical protein